ncbi:MAG: type VII toxin-antitoxin system MntA family adenylyltransferase antitoxin [Halanaerobium sp.]
MDEKIIEKIREIADEKKFIQAVYLFGSQAKGNADTDSDIDIAVLLENDYTEKSGEIKIKLYEELIKAGLDNIDLVILNQASALLKYEVVKENYLVYKKNDFEAASYQSLMIRKYLDFEYYLKQNQQKFKERILNG